MTIHKIKEHITSSIKGHDPLAPTISFRKNQYAVYKRLKYNPKCKQKHMRHNIFHYEREPRNCQQIGAERMCNLKYQVKSLARQCRSNLHSKNQMFKAHASLRTKVTHNPQTNA